MCGLGFRAFGYFDGPSIQRWFNDVINDPRESFLFLWFRSFVLTDATKKNMIKMEKNCFFADLINKLFFGFFLNMTYNENKESLSLSENSSFFFMEKFE